MRKSLVFLLSIFVCAVVSVTAGAQSERNAQSGTVISEPTANTESIGSTPTALSAADIIGQISAARRLLSSRQTSSSDLVTVAAFDPNTSQTSMFSLLK